jgi:hypothetical protein
MLTRIPDCMLESNKESNALARARNRRKCYSYSVEYNTIVRIDRLDGWQRRRLDCKLKDYGDSIAINCPCVAHQICRRARAPINIIINGGSANGDAFVDWHLTIRLSL